MLHRGELRIVAGASDSRSSQVTLASHYQVQYTLGAPGTAPHFPVGLRPRADVYSDLPGFLVADGP